MLDFDFRNHMIPSTKTVKVVVKLKYNILGVGRAHWKKSFSVLDYMGENRI